MMCRSIFVKLFFRWCCYTRNCAARWCEKPEKT